MKRNIFWGDNAVLQPVASLHFFNEPVLAPILHSRSICLIIVGAVALHAGLNAMGLPGWPCPIRHTLGIPCPGCGLSRAMLALLHGDWQASLTYHAFAPLFLLGFVLMAGILMLPGSQRERVIQRVSRLEQTTGIMAIFLIGLVVYWVARLVLLGNAFITLIVG